MDGTAAGKVADALIGIIRHELESRGLWVASKLVGQLHAKVAAELAKRSLESMEVRPAIAKLAGEE